MTQASANPINFGTDSRLDLRKFHGTKIPHALNVTAALAQKFLSASSVKSLSLRFRRRKSLSDQKGMEILDRCT